VGQIVLSRYVVGSGPWNISSSLWNVGSSQWNLCPTRWNGKHLGNKYPAIVVAISFYLPEVLTEVSNIFMSVT
jgi:hypothetical protein